MNKAIDSSNEQAGSRNFHFFARNRRGEVVNPSTHLALSTQPARTTEKLMPMRQNGKDLQSQLRERDAQIEYLQELEKETQSSLSQARAELAEVKNMFVEGMLLQEMEIARLEREKSAMADEMVELGKEINTEYLLAEYASLLRKKSKGAKELNANMQVLLCKALHSMEVLSRQLDAAKKHEEANTRSRQEDIAEILSCKRETEDKLKEKIVEMQNEKAALQQKYTTDIRKKHFQIERLKGSKGENTVKAEGARTTKRGSVLVQLVTKPHKVGDGKGVHFVDDEPSALKAMRDIRRELKLRERRIASLENTVDSMEDIIKAKGRVIGALRLDLKSREHNEMITNQDEQFVEIMHEVSEMTSTVENNIMRSLARKRKLLAHLGNNDSEEVKKTKSVLRSPRETWPVRQTISSNNNNREIYLERRNVENV